MKGIQVRKGAILLWRLGQLTYGEQSRWDRAPAKRGMWSFPWPYYDKNFTEHQYNYYMPKRLKTANNGWPIDPSVFVYPDGSKPAKVVMDEWGYPEDENLNEPASFWTDREQWIETVGRRVLPLRKFWYEGDVLTHIAGRGVSVDKWDMLDTWHRVDSVALATRLRKASGQLPAECGEPNARLRRSAAGPLELFLTPGAGRIS